MMVNRRLTAARGSARHTVVRETYNLPLPLTLSLKWRGDGSDGGIAGSRPYGEASAVALCAVADEEDLETCVFAKRTHRFFADFLMQYPLHKEVMAEMLRRIRWV